VQTIFRAFPISLTHGDHDIGDPVVAWSTDYVPASHPPLVELIASIQSSPRQLGNLSRGRTATSVATRMDARVAMELYEKLGDLIRSMGWQQHITGGRPI
jgi:hypothetical protein